MSNSRQEFTEQEVTQLVTRAAEIQQARGEASEVADQIDRSTLQAACAELGIDEACIDQAIQERQTGEKVNEVTSPIWGGPLKIEIDTTVQKTLSPEDWPALVAELNAITSHGRLPNQGLLEWTHRDLATHVLVTPTSTGTRIQVSTKNGEALMHAFGIWAAIFAAFITSPNFNLNPVVFVITLVTWYLISRYITSLIGRGRKKIALLITQTIRQFIETSHTP